MFVAWDDELCVYLPADDGVEVHDELWHNYTTILRAKMELEELIRGATPELDGDLLALKGVLSDEELQALQSRRNGVVADAPASEAEPVEIPPLAEEAPPAAVTPIGGACPKSPGGQGPHICLRYGHTESGVLVGWCKCGRQIQNPDCPHQTQVRRGRNVACADCGKVIIHNTGYVEDGVGSDRYVPPPAPPSRTHVAVPTAKGW